MQQIVTSLSLLSLLSPAVYATATTELWFSLSFEPIPCHLSVSAPHIRLGHIDLTQLPATGQAPYLLSGDLSWAEEQGTTVNVDCDQQNIRLGLVLLDNQADTLADNAPATAFGLGRFNDSGAMPIGYYQLKPLNTYINNIPHSQLVNSLDGKVWTHSNGFFYSQNHGSHINSWQQFLTSGMHHLTFQLGGLITFNGQDSITEPANSHNINGSVTLMLVVY